MIVKLSAICRLQDIILFEAILSDLFPYTQLTQPDQQQLTAALHSACGQLGLQPGPAFVAKAAQLHDTLGVRFGVMLVGPAGEGSSRGAAAAVGFFFRPVVHVSAVHACCLHFCLHTCLPAGQVGPTCE